MLVSLSQPLNGLIPTVAILGPKVTLERFSHFSLVELITPVVLSSSSRQPKA